jgi:hypothetical protein
MPYERGEDIIIGLGLEDTRGVAVAPQIYIAGITPSGIKTELEYKEIEETVASGMKTQGLEITQTRAAGDLECYLKSNSIGYILKSLLGSCSSVAKEAPNADVYDHTFILDTDVEAPSLTLALQKSIQAYRYLLSVVSSFELSVTPDNLVIAKTDFLSKQEEEVSQFTPSFSSDDTKFRQQDVSVKIADSIEELDGENALVLKGFTLKIASGVAGDPRIGDLKFDNILSKVREIEGSLEGTYKAKTFYDLFKAGAHKAMRLEMTRSDITIGESENPALKIDLPRVSFSGYDQDRAIDDVVNEKIDFKAHYDGSEAKGIEIVLTNEIPEYVAEEESPS